MIEEVLPYLFRLEVPLPNNPLKAINSYIIKSKNRNLIIDTGMNREECMTVFRSGLKELDVNLRETDFFITHMHADHSGLVSQLATDASSVYCSLPDSVMIGPVFSGADWYPDMVKLAGLNGFPEGELQEVLLKHQGLKYCAGESLEFSIVKEGDAITIGDYHFTCLETPGHTSGHMCLYESGKKILVSGDHVLNDITPNISLWSGQGNPLREFIKSLDRVYDLEIDLVLPGHRRVFSNCKGRIEEIKLHHRIRAQEVLAILEKGAANAYQVASRMSWDLTYTSWDLFPAPQKWFATGEAMAHLKYLEEENLIKEEVAGDNVVFTLV